MKRFGMALAVAASAAACGSVSGVDDLFTGNGGAPAGGTTTTTTTGGPGNGSSSSGAATGGAGGTSSTTSSSSGTVATSSSSSSGAVSTSSSSSSASSTSGGPTAQVTCNNQPCNAGEICCFNPSGPGDHCGHAGQCNPGWIELSCNGPEDCPGGACCATVDFNMQEPYQNIACQPSCDQNQLVICSEADPGVCPANTQCKQSMVLGAGYFICAPGG